MNAELCRNANHPAVAQSSAPNYGLLSKFIRHLESDASEGADIGAALMELTRAESQGQSDHSSSDPDTPFLSIVTRTQGRRPDTLREVFLTLSGQTCHDFEVVLVGHKLDAAGEALVRSMVADLPAWLRDRVRLIKVEHGNRTAPLNVGFQNSAGRYTAILDDDDFVFANWVEVFKTLESENPGTVLRTMSLLQDFEEVETCFGTKASRATSSPRSIYPLTFQLLDHIRENKSPPVALAFPSYYFSRLGGRFDETLTTTEDWDYLMRAAFVCGVSSAPIVTSIYRQWVNRENSKTIHPQQEWADNHHRIFDKHDSSPFLMEVGTTKLLRQILEERDQLRAWAKHLAEELRASRTPSPPAEIVRLISEPEPNMPENIAGQRDQVAAILNSTSWRITKILRLARQVTRGTHVDPPDLSTLSIAELRQLGEALRNSTSWRITASVRKMAELTRRLKTGSSADTHSIGR
jgi:hypothetical protein